MLKLSLLVLSTLFFMACTNLRGRGERDMNADVQQETTNVFKYSYSIKEAGCDTGPRVAVSERQFCTNLQLAGQNNNCGEATRRALFNKRCAGTTWAPEEALKLFSTGPTLKCEASAPNSYTNSQVLSDGQMVLPHDRFFAVVSHDSKAKTVSLRLLNAYPTGDVLAEATEADTAEAVSLTTEDKTAKILCRRDLFWPK